MDDKLRIQNVLRSQGVVLADEPPPYVPLDPVAARVKPETVAAIGRPPPGKLKVVAPPPPNPLIATMKPTTEPERHTINRHRIGLNLRPLQAPGRQLSHFEQANAVDRTFTPKFDPESGDIIAYERSDSSGTYRERRAPSGARLSADEKPIEGDLWYDPVNFANELLPGGLTAHLLSRGSRWVAREVTTALRVDVRESFVVLKHTGDHSGPVLTVAAKPKHDGNHAIWTHEGELVPENFIPSQLKDGVAHRQTMDDVLLFSAHGSEFGFVGGSTSEVAGLLSEVIRQAAKEGVEVRTVVLSVCGQRNARLFFGPSNAAVLQRHLDAELGKGVTVLAAARPGPVYPGGRMDQSPWRLSRDITRVDFVPASEPAKMTLGPVEGAVLGSVGILGVEAWLLRH